MYRLASCSWGRSPSNVSSSQTDPTSLWVNYDTGSLYYVAALRKLARRPAKKSDQNTVCSDGISLSGSMLHCFSKCYKMLLKDTCAVLKIFSFSVWFDKHCVHEVLVEKDCCMLEIGKKRIHELRLEHADCLSWVRKYYAPNNRIMSNGCTFGDFGSEKISRRFFSEKTWKPVNLGALGRLMNTE